jgi:protein-S-isoprenylcysteine O-methyltransferase Ste14
MLIAMIWKTLYWAWIVTEVLVLVVTRTRNGGGKISDRGSLAVLWVVIVCSIALSSWSTEVYRPATFRAGSWIVYACLGMMALGLVIRWTAIYTLGKAFSANVAIHARQKLNRSGLFRIMRHPSYTGMVLIFLAMGMATRNGLGLVLFVVPPVVALLYRMHVEEAALTGAFGAEYVEYRRTTKRLIPGIY